MPIYMDRHDVSEMVTAEIVAGLHQQDLKVQHKFGCRGLTYWFDDIRKTAFCLVEAPDIDSVVNMHNHSHGVLPHQIIEVDSTIVESFLGRIEDPQKAQNTNLNIINDPAFRTIMVINLKKSTLENYDFSHSNLIQNIYKSILEIIEDNIGRVVNQTDEGFLVSFKSVTKAVLCAKEIQTVFRLLTVSPENKFLSLLIGLSAGVPVTEKKSIFEDTIKLADRMSQIANAEIVVSTEVKDLFKSENCNQFIKNELVVSLTSEEEKFLTRLMEFTEKEWKNADLKVDDFNNFLGHSKSQLYRKMMSLIGKSPNAFLMSYRLNIALKLLKKQKGNISEIAFEAGFNSPSYFSKCFQKKFNLLPSEYLRTVEG